MLSSLSGKIVRLDPETGDGVPGNPFFDPSNPRSAPSRIWSLGLRNPFAFRFVPAPAAIDTRTRIRACSTSVTLALHGFEDLNVVTGPGLNFGWPIYEGLESHATFRNSTVANQDAPNRCLGPEVAHSSISPFAIFSFRTRSIRRVGRTHATPHSRFPSSITRFVHTRPAIDWRHENGPARTGIYTTNGTAAVTNIGAPARRCQDLSLAAPVLSAAFGIRAMIFQRCTRTRIFTPITKAVDSQLRVRHEQ